MNLREVAETWLAQVLSNLTYNDIAVDVHRHPAPEQASYPVITVGLRTAVDISPIGLGGTIEKITYDVSAWDEGLSSTSVNALAKKINDALLTAFPAAVTGGGSIVSCRRIGAVIVPQIVEQGKTYQRDGAVYELIVANN